MIDKSSPRKSADLQALHDVTGDEDHRDSSEAAEEPKLLVLEPAARRRTVCAPPGPILVESDRSGGQDRPLELENLNEKRSPRTVVPPLVATIPYTLQEAGRRRSVIQAPKESSIFGESPAGLKADFGDENRSTAPQFGSSGRRTTLAYQSSAASARSWARSLESRSACGSAAQESRFSPEDLQNTAVRVALKELNRGHDREPWSPPSLSPTARSCLSGNSLDPSPRLRASFQRSLRDSGSFSSRGAVEHLENDTVILADAPTQQCRTMNAPCMVLETAPLNEREQLFQVAGAHPLRAETPDGRSEPETEREPSRQVEAPVLAALCELGVLGVAPSRGSSNSTSCQQSSHVVNDQKKRSVGGSKSSVDVYDIAADTSEAIYTLSGLPPKRASLCKASESNVSANAGPVSPRLHDFDRALEEGISTHQADAHPQWADRKRRRYGPFPVLAQRG